METPKEWPLEIAESYNPIRVLGSGGFASVVLAKCQKKNQESISNGNPTGNNATSSSNSSSIVSNPNKVAIKVIGCNDGTGNYDAAFLYAKREIEILQQIRHSGIVKLYYSWEGYNLKPPQERDEGEDKAHTKRQQQQPPPGASSPTAGVLVLEYIKGPTVESLLKHGGALSSTFARVVIAQVLDAVAYLHYRAVIHRDIKPDNILVTGALSSDASIWENDTNNNKNTPSGSCRNDKSPDDWKCLCFKWKATIIDFGFARALTPGDLENDVTSAAATTTTKKMSRSASPSRHPVKQDAGYLNTDIYKGDQKKKKYLNIFRSISTGSISELDTSMRSTRSEGSVGSVSHKMKRVMSTLGNRNFAAPEIVNKVRQLTAQEKKKETQKESSQQTKGMSDTTKTISAFVADYGVLADSYSMGLTIQYMMTGVVPGVSIDGTMKKQQRADRIKKVFSKIGLAKKKTTEKKKLRKPRYRSMEDVPGQVLLLVKRLTHLSPHKRISVRKARRTTAWISEVLSFQEAKHQSNYYFELPSNECTGSQQQQQELQQHNPVATLSLEYVSEEQIHSLDETRYLPLATATPGSVGSTHGATHTVKTIDSINDFPLGSDDNNSNSNSNFNKENYYVGNDDDDVDDVGIILDLEDDMVTF